MGIPIAVIAEALGQTFPVIDVTVENWKSPNKTSNINYGGITVYVRCQSVQEALDIPGKIQIGEQEIGIWHAGMKLCTECGERGHTAQGHEYVMKRRKAHEKKLKQMKRRSKPLKP